MDLEVVALIGAMTWTAVSFLKHLSAGKLNDALTLLIVVAVSIGVAFLVRAAEMAFVGDNAAKVFIAGYAASSALRVVYEYKKAIDGSDSAAETKLIPDGQ